MGDRTRHMASRSAALGGMASGVPREEEGRPCASVISSGRRAVGAFLVPHAHLTFVNL